MENEYSAKKGLRASLRESFFGIRPQSLSAGTKTVSLMGMLAALIIVFERTIYIPVGDSSRYSFAFIMIFVSGIVLGAVKAAVVGAIADIVGAIIAGYSINPLITICVALSAFFCGLLLYSDRSYVRLGIAILLDQVLCSLLLKSAAFAIWYGGGMHSYPKYFMIRIVQAGIMIPVECVVLFILNRVLFPRLKKLTMGLTENE
jgi:ECF transporter S component (folate family)